MPYSPFSTVINTDITLRGDVTGSVYNTAVVSLNNINTGTLPIEHGGTGINSIPSGSLLVGGINTLSYITASEYEIPIFKNGYWSAGDIFSSINIELTSSDDTLFTINSASTPSLRQFNISLKGQGPKKFFVTPESGGLPYFRELDYSDLPRSYNDITIYNSYVSGTSDLSGTFFGTFFGDGNSIQNINVNNISGLSNYFQNALYSVNNLSITNLEVLNSFTSSYAKIGSGDINGKFNGDGKDIYNISTDNIVSFEEKINEAIDTKLSITGIFPIKEAVLSSVFPGRGIDISDDGVISTSFPEPIIPELRANDSSIFIYTTSNTSSFLVNPNLEIFNIKAFSAQFEQVSSSFLGNFFGNGIGLTNLSSDNLDKKSIKINNTDVYLGDSINISGINDVISSRNIETTNISGTIVLDLEDEIEIDTLTALENVYSNAVTSNIVNANSVYVTGTVSASSFTGDGSGLRNVTLASVSDFDERVINAIRLDNNNILFSGSVIKLSNNLLVDSISANNIATNNISLNSITASSLSAADVKTTSLSASSLSINSLEINTTLSASYIFGNGSNIQNIDYNSLLNKPDLNPYLTTADLDVTKDYITSSISYFEERVSQLQNDVFNNGTVQTYLQFYATGLNIGDVVCFNNNVIEKADKSSLNKSKAFGMVYLTSDGLVFIKNGGELAYDLTNYSIGEFIYLGNNGSLCKYSELLPGDYATCIGQKTINNKLLIDIKHKWKVG